MRDLIEVVRCGECKYMDSDGRCWEFADERIRPSSADFCSYGERRTDEVARGMGVSLNTEQQQIPEGSPVCGEGCEYFTDYNGNQGEYKQMSEIKTWKVRYEHKDGRKGTVDVVTEIEKRENTYGNGKYGRLSVEGFSQIYDLRYATGDLHKLMLKSYFGSGLISAE